MKINQERTKPFKKLADATDWDGLIKELRDYQKTMDINQVDSRETPIKPFHTPKCNPQCLHDVNGHHYKYKDGLSKRCKCGNSNRRIDHFIRKVGSYYGNKTMEETLPVDITILGLKQSEYWYGGVGTGKTTAALHMIKNFIVGQGKDHQYLIWNDHLNFAKGIIANKQEYIPSYPKRLVIDEFCQKPLSEFDKNLFFHLIDHYQRSKDLLILISNKTPNQIESMIDRRSFDRLSSYLQVREFKGESMRKKQGGWND